MLTKVDLIKIFVGKKVRLFEFMNGFHIEEIDNSTSDNYWKINEVSKEMIEIQYFFRKTPKDLYAKTYFLSTDLILKIEMKLGADYHSSKPW